MTQKSLTLIIGIILLGIYIFFFACDASKCKEVEVARQVDHISSTGMLLYNAEPVLTDTCIADTLVSANGSLYEHTLCFQVTTDDESL